MTKRSKPQNDVERVEHLSPQQKVIFYLWCEGWTLRLIATRSKRDESSIQQQFYRIIHDKFEVEFFDIAERNRILKQRFCPSIGQFVDAKTLSHEIPQLEILQLGSGELDTQIAPTTEEQLAVILLGAEDDAREEGKPPETALAIFRGLIPRNPDTTGIQSSTVIDVDARRIRRWPPVLTYILGILTVATPIIMAIWQHWLPLTVNTQVPVPLTVVVEKLIDKTVVVTAVPQATYTAMPLLPTYTPLAPLPTYTALPPLPTYTPSPTASPLPAMIDPSALTATVSSTVEATPVVTPTISIPVPFEDTFDKDKRPEWRLAEGNYLVEGGHLTPGTAGTFILELGDTGLTDYTVEFDYTGNLLYRFGESLRLNVDTSIGYDCYLETWQDGQWVRLRQIGCPPGGHFKGRINGNVFTASYNDTPVFDFAYQTQSKNRAPFRFRISGGTLDNFKLTAP